MNVPTVGEVDTIAGLTDPVVRNLRITQCYHELSAAVAERVAPGANWCTFATWASRQAGRTIRGEDLEEQIATRLAGSAELLHPLVSLWRWLLRRGLLNPRSRLRQLMEQRRPIYESLAAITVATDGREPEDVVTEIEAAL